MRQTSLARLWTQRVSPTASTNFTRKFLTAEKSSVTPLVSWWSPLRGRRCVKPPLKRQGLITVTLIQVLTTGAHLPWRRWSLPAVKTSTPSRQLSSVAPSRSFTHHRQPNGTCRR